MAVRRVNAILSGAAALALATCSPEARRVRDGGAGADPGNKVLVTHEFPDPHAADTTLWPGRAAAPVDRLARGVIAPPTYPAADTATPPSQAQQQTFDRGRPADPRRRTDRP